MPQRRAIPKRGKSSKHVSPKTPRSRAKSRERWGELRLLKEVKNEKRDCFSGWLNQQKLAEGSWGEVYSVCDRQNNCDFAIKLTMLKNGYDDLLVAIRDAYFCRKLKDQKLDGQQMVPRVIDDWRCQSSQGFPYYAVAMEQFETNLWSVTRERAHTHGLDQGRYKNEEILLYTLPELLRIYRLNYKLGKLGILYGDSKPDNYLVRGSLIVAADFGFCGLCQEKSKGVKGFVSSAGWNSNEKRPPKKFLCSAQPVNYISSPKEASIYNIFQLESYLVSEGINCPAYVMGADGKTIHQFLGVRGFAEQLRAASFMSKFCPTFKLDNYQKILQQWTQQTQFPTLQLSWDQISK